jgi:flagellar motor switch protein FliN/FliY
MADDKIISQDDIEKLLSQPAGGAAPAAKSATPPSTAPADASGVQGAAANAPASDAAPTKSAPASSISNEEQDKLLAQADIEKLLGQTSKSPPGKTKDLPPGPLVGEGSMAEKDIEFLLNQAEKALESIGSAAGNDLPQGVSAFRLQELSGAPASTDTATLDLVRDVELNLRIELGRTHMYLEDVLKLRKGSVVPLDKLAGDPVDVFVNGRLVARGEVLVLNDNFCVRVAELITGANAFN